VPHFFFHPLLFMIVLQWTKCSPRIRLMEYTESGRRTAFEFFFPEDALTGFVFLFPFWQVPRSRNPVKRVLLYARFGHYSRYGEVWALRFLPLSVPLLAPQITQILNQTFLDPTALRRFGPSCKGKRNYRRFPFSLSPF